MADILQTIVEHKRQEIEAWKAVRPMAELRAMATAPGLAKPPTMRQSLLSSPTGIIAEFKRKSPSKGWIRRDGDPVAVARAYEKAGAAAMSVLTDEQFFGGTDADMAAIKASGVALPLLYKNFVIDEYQLYQARISGASAVLLIAACLTMERTAELIDAAHALGLEVLLEMHGEDELRYAALDADLCGINNRNLGSFVTSTDNSLRVARLLPHDKVWVSESGLSRAATVVELRRAGFRGFLIGENFMSQPSPGDALSRFAGEIAGQLQSVDDALCPTPTADNGQRLLVKVCGMREADNIRQVEEAGADLIGMIFYPPSPRNVSLESSLAGTLPDRVATADAPSTDSDCGRKAKRVGVFVDATAQQVLTMVVLFNLDFVQLHGHETPTFIDNLRRTLDGGVRPGVRFIKTVSVEKAEDIDNYRPYEHSADMILFDTQCPTAGGSGQKFDWDALRGYQGSLPFILSGGIGPDDAERIAALKLPKMIGIDINSRFETAPAVKDAKLVGEFITKVRGLSEEF